ncbi:MAG: MATE family efflux transporter [Merdibacter sp.]
MKENKMGTMEVRRLILTMSLPIMTHAGTGALQHRRQHVCRQGQRSGAGGGLTVLSIQMIMVAVACGTGSGSMLCFPLPGRERNGEGQPGGHAGLFCAICNWLVFAVVGLFFSEAFLCLFSDDVQIIMMGISYMQICTICSFGVFVQITYERIMQSTGNTIYNMVIQGVGALTNIILDPIFIFGLGPVPALGTAGAAIATVIGQIVAMFLGIIITQKKIREIQLSVRGFHLDGMIMKAMYRIAIPAILMQSIMSFMTVMMNMILAPFSEMAVSVFSIYYKLQQFVFMAVLGMNNALIPILSYNYGAHQMERIREGIRFALWMSCVIMAIGTVVFQLLPTQLLYLFDAKETLLSIGIPALRTISVSFVFAGISMVLCSVFQALGSPNHSLLVTLLRQMVILLPLAYGFSSAFGLDMCWWSFPITEVLCALLSLYLLRSVQKRVLLQLQ